MAISQIIRKIGLAAILFGSPAMAREFKHPGVISTQAELAELKQRVEKDENVRKAFAALQRSPFADPKRPHTPYGVVKVVASGSCDEEEAFRGDAQAAHAMALMWVITGKAAYRDKSVAILNDWARTYQRIESTSKQVTHQGWLECAWAAPIWTAAADIIRYHNQGAAGWTKADIAQFDRFLNRMVETARQAGKMNNNWGTSATLAVIAAAVYQEDVVAYENALKTHQKQLQSISKTSGALGPDYLRDPWHPQYTLTGWIQTCEIAWNQGDDLYATTLDGQTLPRLAICLEHFAKLFTGQLPDPKGLKKGNYKGSHAKRQSYEIAHNHYISRRGMTASLSTFEQLVPPWRPGGLDDHFIGWDALTHGGLQAKTSRNTGQR